MQTDSSLHYNISERAFSWMIFCTRLVSSLVLFYISLGGLLFYREFLYNAAAAGLPLPVGIGLLLAQIIFAFFVLLGFFARFCAGACLVCLAGVGFLFFGLDFNKIYIALVLLLAAALLPTLMVGAGRFSVDFNRARRQLQRQTRR